VPSLRYLEINGVWEDHIRYAITSEDWAERREQFLRDWILPSD
jgi:ribosomal-protein-alanine N-acetyltransferase